jgi:DNA primase
VVTTPSEWFGKVTHRRAFELLRQAMGGSGDTPAISTLVAEAQSRPGGDQLARLVAVLAIEPVKAGEHPVEEYAERVFLRLQEFWLKRQVDSVRKELERLNPLKAPADHVSLFEQLVALEGARREVRARAEAVGVSR